MDNSSAWTPRRPYPRPRATPPWHRLAPNVYRPGRPTRTPLYQVVQHHLETFLANASEAGGRTRNRSRKGLAPDISDRIF
ncbi:MAG: hypothetical protein FJ207_08795 [Gemmatimonadetes bacterium]|nr:hypothetical protein [Gemmatimonadota bacterium]